MSETGQRKVLFLEVELLRMDQNLDRTRKGIQKDMTACTQTISYGLLEPCVDHEGHN